MKVPKLLWTLPFTSVVECVNVLSSVTDATSKVPLYPLSNVPEVLSALVTFLMITLSPTLRSCGNSDTTVTVLDDTEQVLINLGFLL